MPSYTFLTTLGAALPLIAGLVLQLCALRLAGKGGVCCLGGGAVLVASFALYDRDMTLLLAQVLVLPLLWLFRNKVKRP